MPALWPRAGVPSRCGADVLEATCCGVWLGPSDVRARVMRCMAFLIHRCCTKGMINLEHTGQGAWRETLADGAKRQRALLQKRWATVMLVTCWIPACGAFIYAAAAQRVGDHHVLDALALKSGVADVHHHCRGVGPSLQDSCAGPVVD